MTVFGVVPVKDLQGTKSRLAPIANPGARAGLTLYMMGRVLSALRGAGVARSAVVSPDRLVLQMAAERGAVPLRQESRGLNPALEEGRRWAIRGGASGMLILPSDLPLVEPDDVAALLEAAGDGPSGVISPDGAASGTNALLLKPPSALPFAFGPESYATHTQAARSLGVRLFVVEREHLAFDLDTEGDLARLEADRSGWRS